MKKELGSIKRSVSICIALILLLTSSGTAYAKSEKNSKKLLIETESAVIEIDSNSLLKSISGKAMLVSDGSEITVIANQNKGYAIAGWEVTSYNGSYSEITPYTANGYSFQLTVYDYNYKIKPIYKKLEYNSTFYSCMLLSENYEAFTTGNGGFTVKATSGSTIRVKAISRNGYKLKQWKISSVSNDGESVKKIPAVNDELLLNINCCDYKTVPIYEKEKYNVYIDSPNITVSGGDFYATSDGFSTDIEWGTDINVVASEINGKLFSGWSISGLKLTEQEAKSKKLTFSMPMTDIRISALYQNILSDSSAAKVGANVTAERYNIDVKTVFIMIISFVLFSTALYGIIKKVISS